MFNILLVGNFSGNFKNLSMDLKKYGYKTLSACDGNAALDLLCHTRADLIIFESNFPKVRAHEFLRFLRLSGSYTPVIVISNNNSIEEKRQAFKNGADDFLCIPFVEEELSLRIEAVLRRCRLASDHIIKIGETVLDYKKLSVSKGEKSVVLPKKEFYLLFKLLCSPGQIFSREQIMDEIWGMDSETDSRTVDVHIRRLRKKLEDFDDFKIISVRGIGYKAEKNKNCKGKN